jgi:hypothetical protein
MVDSLLDVSNATDGKTTLREAIAAAGALAGPDTVAFIPGLSGEIVLTSTLQLGSGGITMNGNLTIEGPGADLLTINRNGGSVHFSLQVQSQAYDFTLRGVSLTGSSGFSVIKGSGGSTSVTLDGVEVYGNGGGASIVYGGALNVLNSTIAFNTGAAVSVGYASAVVTNSTISNNESSGPLAGLSVDFGTINMTSSTVANNRASKDYTGVITSTTTGGVFAGNAGSVLMKHSIVADNFAGAPGVNELRRDINRQATGYYTGNLIGSYNLIGYDSVTGNGIDNNVSNNQVGGEGASSALNPQLSPLALYGGHTRTRALKAGSPALDKGDPTSVAGSGGVPLYDQRGVGYSRVLDGDSTAGARIDLGAVEAGTTNKLIVTVVDDESDGNYAVNDLSLREAILLASGTAGADLITFAPGLFLHDPLGRDRITLTSALAIGSPLAPLKGDLTIDGCGAIIDGNSAMGQVFELNTGVGDVVFRDMTITGALLNGIWKSSPYGTMDLTLDHVHVVGNAGRGVLFSYNGTLSILDSEISNNGGGGVSTGYVGLTITNSTIADNGGTGVSTAYTTATLTNVTISGNETAGASTAGVQATWGSMTLNNVTVANNRADINNFGTSTSIGGVLAGMYSTVTVKNSLIANNSAGYEYYYAYADIGRQSPTTSTLTGTYNFIGYDATTGNGVDDGVGGNQVGGENFTWPLDPKLTPLGSYGGVTRTHALLAGSEAIDAADPAAVAGSGGVPLLDQRRANRILDGDGAGGARLDAGAYEYTAPKVYIDDAIAAENGVLRLHLTLTQPVDYGFFVYVNPVDGSATSSDYSPYAYYAYFPAYETEAHVDYQISNDVLIEGVETFFVELTPYNPGFDPPISKDRAEVRIIDNLEWLTRGEVRILPNNVIELGDNPSRGENEFTQPQDYHGVSIPIGVPANAGPYAVNFSADLETWDSYSEPEETPPTPPVRTGYWDSFSVSVTPTRYSEWAVGRLDPFYSDDHFGFLWGGEFFGDGIEETYDATGSQVTIAAGDFNPAGNFLNVMLDTRTNPSEDAKHPSYGLLTLNNVFFAGKFSGIRVQDVAYSESNSKAYVVVELGDITSNTVTVDYVTRNGTATDGQDFVGKQGTLTFAQGQRLGVVEIELAKDLVFEQAEDFYLDLFNPTNTRIAEGGGSAKVTLYEDDYASAQAAANVRGPLVDTWSSSFASGTGLGPVQLTTEQPIDLLQDGSVMFLTPELLFQSAATGNWTWNTSVTNGAKYEVRLHFAEISASVTGAGQRRFNVGINGSTVLSNFDIFQEAGGKYAGVTKSFVTTATSSTLSVNFAGVTGSALISAIEVFRVA